MPSALPTQPPLDAVIAGGGPAGAATAIHLARAGRRVLVVERERFPRFHVGESLLPASHGLLDELGGLDRVAALPHRPTYLHPPATAHHEPHGHGTDPMGSTA